MAIVVNDAAEVTAADLTASRRLAVDAELLPVGNAHADDEVNADELRLFPHPTTMARPLGYSVAQDGHGSASKGLLRYHRLCSLGEREAGDIERRRREDIMVLLLFLLGGGD